MRDRFFRRTALGEKISQICVRLHECWINLDGFAEFLDRFCKSTALSKSKTEIVVRET